MTMTTITTTRRPTVIQAAMVVTTAPEMRMVRTVPAAGTAKHRLAELPDHAMPPVLAGTAVLEKIPGNPDQAKGIVKLPIGEKPAVRGDLGTVKLKLQAAVKINPQRRLSAFTRQMIWSALVLFWVLH